MEAVAPVGAAEAKAAGAIDLVEPLLRGHGLDVEDRMVEDLRLDDPRGIDVVVRVERDEQVVGPGGTGGFIQYVTLTGSPSTAGRSGVQTFHAAQAPLRWGMRPGSVCRVTWLG